MFCSLCVNKCIVGLFVDVDVAPCSFIHYLQPVCFITTPLLSYKDERVTLLNDVEQLLVQVIVL